MPSSIDVAADLTQKLEEELAETETEKMVLWEMGVVCEEGAEVDTKDLEEGVYDQPYRNVWDSDGTELVDQVEHSTATRRRNSETACADACSKISTCNYSYHIENCDANGQNCDPKCYHSQTCNKIRSTQESVYTRKSLAEEEEPQQESIVGLSTESEGWTWVQITMWTLTGILLLLLILFIVRMIRSRRG